MPRGANLTDGEKFAMQKLREEGKTYGEIAKVLGKGRETIKRWFERQGDNLVEVRGKLVSPKDVAEEIKDAIKKETESVQEDIKEQIFKEEPEVVPVKKKTVGRVSKPPKKKPFHHLTVRKDSEGKPMGTGIAVMTPNASERADDFQKTLPTGRLGKGAIFDIKQGKIRE